MKMEKTPRYTQRERNMVLGFAAQYKDVIENKRTDAESNRKKDEVWRQISREFNARVYHQRSAKQLRQLYKNMKLLLKKDLCGEGKGNRSFMDLLNTLSQQESVTQYISEQMSPGSYSSRQQKYDDDYDDSKLPSVSYDGMDSDVILIKSEDISDNEQSQNEGNLDDMDDDDDDCLSPKDIPEVCLEEEDDEIFATDLRQTPIQLHPHSHRQQLQRQNQSQSGQQVPKPEIVIQNVGPIRVGSIGSLANMKSLQNGSNNSALSITQASSNSGTSSSSNPNGNGNGNGNGIGSSTNNNNNSTSNNNHSGSSRQTSSEQAQQNLLLNGLGLSAVNQQIDQSSQPPLPTLQRGNTHHHNGFSQGASNLLSFNGQSFGSKSTSAAFLGSFGNTSSAGNHNGGNGNCNGSGSGSGSGSGNANRNDYLMSLAIEERKRKIDLLNAQIEYWQTLTKKLDANSGHSPMPACLCHFPGKLNGLQTPTSNS